MSRLLRDSTSSVVLLSRATRCRGGGFKASAGSRCARRASARRRGLILPTALTLFTEATNEATMSWTDERVEQLKQHWMEGKSASQIASLLGNGLTRNAVIGKVHRLGLAGRAKSPGLAVRVPAASAPRRPRIGSPRRAWRRLRPRMTRGATALAIAPQALTDDRAGGVRERRRADVAQGDDRRTERSDVPLAAGRPGQFRIPLLRIARGVRSLLRLPWLPRLSAGPGARRERDRLRRAALR